MKHVKFKRKLELDNLTNAIGISDYLKHTLMSKEDVVFIIVTISLLILCSMGFIAFASS